jgi:HEAT repeat protein
MIPLFTQCQAISVSTAVLLLTSVGPCWAQQTDMMTRLKAALAGEAQDRYAAIDDLGERHAAADQVVPTLKQLLGDEDVQVRWRSARALGDYGPLAQEAVADLRALLSADDAAVRYHAAVALGKIEDRSDETVRALVTAVVSSDGHVTRAAISALRALKPDPKHVMPIVQEVLASDDPTVAVHALEALVDQGSAAVPFLKEALKRKETAYLACTAIAEVGADAAATVPELAKLLGTTSHSQLQIQALLALAKIGPKAHSAGPAILPLLESPSDETVPAAAAYALGAIGAKEAVAELRKAMAKDNAFLQMTAAWSLAKLQPDDSVAMQQAVDKLTRGLSNDDPLMRTAAAKGLQMLEAPAEMVAPALMAVANDPNPDVSENVVIALASLGEAIVPRVVKALESPDRRPLALRVLTELGPEASDAVIPLVDAIPAANPDVRAKIHFVLAAIGPDAAPATDALVKGLASEDERVRHSALYALRMIGPGAQSATQALLLALAEGDDSFDALAAAWALATIAPSNPDAAGKAVPVLIRGLSSAEEHVRLECAEALAVWGPAARGAIPVLMRLVEEDDSQSVRESAHAALARLQG